MLLYMHIPYCDSKCHYCSFNSYVDRFDTRSKYMKTLAKQLLFELKKFEVQPHEIESVFIGGGTPSTIAPERYQPIFEILQPFLEHKAEITVEANPNSATLEWLRGMYALGVNRLSFGVQSFDNQKLKSLNRAHTDKNAIFAINHAKEVGFEHISMDLIYNYQGDSKKLLESDINQAFDLPIDHISAYELTIEEQTKFADTPDVKQDNDSLAFFVAEQIIERGFTHYEISNFGRYQSRHNKGYWQLKDYLGVGAGAVGFKQNYRYYPSTDIEHYIADPLNSRQEIIDQEELLTEKVFLGLRSNIGIYEESLTPEMKERCDTLVSKNKLIKQKNFYQNRNFFIADEIALYILG